MDQCLPRQPKLRAGDGRNAREAPVFIARGRETNLGKAREPVFADLSQPWEIPPGSLSLKVGEVLEMNPQILG